MNKTIKIAIPQWQGFVSTVFDFACKLLLIDTEEQKQINRSEVALPEEPMPQRAVRLKNLGVNVLICGAISRPLAFMITGLRIKVLPYVSGPVDQVLNAYLAGQLTQQRFLMPGCGAGARKGFGRRRRGCRWRGGRL
jgi:predicted Fe-Mo cluster-binding NifX family protein